MKAADFILGICSGDPIIFMPKLRYADLCRISSDRKVRECLEKFGISVESKPNPFKISSVEGDFIEVVFDGPGGYKTYRVYDNQLLHHWLIAKSKADGSQIDDLEEEAITCLSAIDGSNIHTYPRVNYIVTEI